MTSDLNIEEIEFNVKNPIITTRKGRPAGRAKSYIEIQEQHTRKRRHLQPLDVNNQNTNISDNAGESVNEEDKWKTCQNCEKKRHNRATCKFNKN